MALFENGIEALVRCPCVGIDVTACCFTSLTERFRISDEVVHEGREGGGILILERTATSLECLCLAELLIVGTKDDGDAIHSGFGHIVDAYAKATSDKRHLTIAIDGREFTKAVDNQRTNLLVRRRTFSLF